jgi:hypothetical protein
MDASADQSGGRYKVLSTLWQTSEGSCCLIFRPDTKQTLVLESFSRAQWEARQAGVWLQRLVAAPGLMPDVLEHRGDEHAARIVSAVPAGRSLSSDGNAWAADTSGRRAGNLARAIGRLHAAGFIHGALQPAAVYASADAAALVGPGTVAFHSAGGGSGIELAEALQKWAAPELLVDSPDSATDYFALGQMLKAFCPNLPPRLRGQLDGLAHENPDQRAAIGLGFTAPPPRPAGRRILAACGVLLVAGLAAWWLLRGAPPEDAGRGATDPASTRRASPKEKPPDADRKVTTAVQAPKDPAEIYEEESLDDLLAEDDPLFLLITAAEPKTPVASPAAEPARTAIVIPTDIPRAKGRDKSIYTEADQPKPAKRR